MDSPPESPRTVVAVADIERPGQNNVLFPWKLHEMLKTSVTDNREKIVSWLPHGNAFKVHNVPEFVGTILPAFFKQTKYKSFQRQLNLWGFERIQNGPEKGAYYHDQFLRDDPGLCRHLTRQRARKFSAAMAAAAADATADADTPVAPSKVPSDAKAASTKKAPASKKPSAAKKPSAPAPPLVLNVGKTTSKLPRKVSEASLGALDVLMDKFDVYYQDPLDLAEFEGFTFHLLEQDRYEELNLEFKFKPTVQPQTPEEEGSNAQELLLELEQGVFGIPKTMFDVTGHDKIPAALSV
jgi:HSF-type DNA-binding